MHVPLGHFLAMLRGERLGRRAMLTRCSIRGLSDFAKPVRGSLGLAHSPPREDDRHQSGNHRKHSCNGIHSGQRSGENHVYDGRWTAAVSGCARYRLSMGPEHPKPPLDQGKPQVCVTENARCNGLR